MIWWRRADIAVQLLGVAVLAWLGFAGPWHAQPCGQYSAFVIYCCMVILLVTLTGDLLRTIWAS